VTTNVNCYDSAAAAADDDDVDDDDDAASLMFQESSYPFLGVVLPVKDGMSVVGRLQGWNGTIHAVCGPPYEPYSSVHISPQ